SGNTLLGLKLDPYERSFRLVRVHVLIPNGSVLDAETLRGALAAGHCFIGFDLFSDSSGFRFTGANANETRIQGDEIKLESEIRLNVTAPISSRIVLLRDGNVIQIESGLTRKEFTVTERGSYRVELYLPQLPGSVSEQPWILSNPIYVR
nr:histidinol phosphatase [Pyrinomonadaceae bacterium]